MSDTESNFDKLVRNLEEQGRIITCNDVFLIDPEQMLKDHIACCHQSANSITDAANTTVPSAVGLVLNRP